MSFNANGVWAIYRFEIARFGRTILTSLARRAYREEQIGIDAETVRVVVPIGVGFDRDGADRDAGCGDELHVEDLPAGPEATILSAITHPRAIDRQRCNYSDVILP